MKIIFTVDCFVRSSLGGGLLRHVKYARELKKRGIESEWLTLQSDADDAFQEHWGLKVRVVPMPTGATVQEQREGLLREAYRVAAALPMGGRVVSTDSCGVSWNTALQVWRARLAGIPSSHNTSMFPGPMPSSILGSLKLKLQGGLFFRGLKKLLAQTSETGRFFRSYFQLSENKIEVLSNGVDVQRFNPATPELKRAARERLGLPADAPVILSVGSVVPRKGMEILIRAWPQVLMQRSNARLVIVGSVGRRTTFMDKASVLDDYTSQTKTLIEGLPFPQSVMLSGREVEDVIDYYHAADGFAFASEREGLPNAVLEAMACGLPCLLSPYAGFPADGEELGFAGQHFFKCERSVEALASGMKALLSADPAAGALAREWMLKHHRLDLMLDRWAEVYRTIAAV